MSTWLKMVILMALCVIAVIMYSLLVAASNADDMAEQMRKELEEDGRLTENADNKI